MNPASEPCKECNLVLPITARGLCGACYRLEWLAKAARGEVRKRGEKPSPPRPALPKPTAADLARYPDYQIHWIEDFREEMRAARKGGA